MKYVKIFAVVAFANVTITTSAIAQKNKGEGDAAFNKGSKTLGFALGLGVDYGYGTYYGGNVVNLPALILIYDQGFFENVGPGTIGIGGLIGVKSSHYNYYDNFHGYNYSYKNTYTNFILGFRGSYHLTILKDKNNKFDPYAGVTIGVRIFTHNNNDPYDTNIYNYNSVYPVAGAFIGAKYNLTPHFGFFAEAGYDISLLRIGFNINF